MTLEVLQFQDLLRKEDRLETVLDPLKIGGAIAQQALAMAGEDKGRAQKEQAEQDPRNRSRFFGGSVFETPGAQQVAPVAVVTKERIQAEAVLNDLRAVQIPAQLPALFSHVDGLLQAGAFDASNLRAILSHLRENPMTVLSSETGEKLEAEEALIELAEVLAELANSRSAVDDPDAPASDPLSRVKLLGRYNALKGAFGE